MPSDKLKLEAGILEVWKLQKDQTISLTLGQETALLLMSGSVNGKFGDLPFEFNRQSLFDESSSCLHGAAGAHLEATCTSDTEFTVYSCNNSKSFEARVFTPDSVYVDAPFIGIDNGSINYSNQRLDNWNTNITTFVGPVDYTVSSQYLPSSQVDQYNMFYISPLMGNSGITDQLTYTNGGLLEFKKRFDFFNSNNIFDEEFRFR